MVEIKIKQTQMIHESAADSNMAKAYFVRAKIYCFSVTSICLKMGKCLAVLAD